MTFEQLKQTREYQMSRTTWRWFLTAHADECDLDVTIDHMAEKVLELAKDNRRVRDENIRVF